MRFVGPFLIPLVAAFAATPLIRRVAIHFGVVDLPSERKVHNEPIPRLGGVAIYLAFLMASLLTAPQPGKLLGLLVGATLIVILGIVDDVRELSARTKFVGQIAAALVMALLGTRIEFLTNPFGGLLFLGNWSIPLTVLWVVSFTNMLNLIDGLDGLAAGVASIAATAIFIVAVSKGQIEVAVLAIILAGSAIGFLPHNFNPAKIFMGDSGSMFLGFVLAGISTEGALKGAATFALVVPVVALGLPVSDTIFAIIRRYQNGAPIHKPDRGHIHHRLLAMGLSQKRAVLFMYVISGGLGAAAVILARMSTLPAMFFIVVVCGALILLAERLEVIKPVRPRGRGLGM